MKSDSCRCERVDSIFTVLFRDALIVTMDAQRRIIKGNLLVEDDRIKAVDPENGLADRIIDCHGKVLIPGLIQTHIHIVQTLFRGQADDLPLLDWLRQKIWPLEAAHDAESVYYSALLGISELLRGGTTAIVDMATVNHTDSVFQAILESGIRAISGKCMMDSGDDMPPGLSESTERLCRKVLICLKNGTAGRIITCNMLLIPVLCSPAATNCLSEPGNWPSVNDQSGLERLAQYIVRAPIS